MKLYERKTLLTILSVMSVTQKPQYIRRRDISLRMMALMMMRTMILMMMRNSY